MQLNKKVKAFTLSEMMVVLVISAIVISLAITVLNLVKQQIKSINAHYDSANEVRILTKALQFDFNTHELYYNSKEDLIICTSSKETIRYQIDSTFILRNSDTIKVKVLDYSVFLDGAKVKDFTMDALSISFGDELKSKELFVHKPKAAAHYMNNYGL